MAMEKSVDELLRDGWLLHQRRQFAEAERIYRQVLTHGTTRDPRAQFALGRLLFERGEAALSIEYLTAAAQRDPSQAVYHAGLAEALQSLGRLNEAVEHYRTAVTLRPNYAEAHINLGNTLLAAQRPIEAVASYREAIRSKPESAIAHSCLGAALENQGQLDEAIACFRRALELRPNFAQALSNLGTALRKQTRFDEAIAPLRRAIELAPRMVAAHNNLGAVYRSLGRIDEAQQCYEKALSIEPEVPQSHSNLAMILMDQGKMPEAISRLDEALRLNPECAEARFSQAMALLSLGRFREGWQAYEYRIRCRRPDILQLEQPMWDGSELGERTLLVHAEQGLGDMLQFVRYVPLLADRARHVLAAVPKTLIPLLTQSGFSNLVPREGPLPPFDVHLPLMSLPYLLGTELETIPHDIPYLSADPAREQRWGERLAAYDGLRVGIAWHGSPVFHGNALRSIPLARFGPLGSIPGVRLFSLQKGEGSQQAAQADAPAGLVTFDDLDLEGGAFLDTAAVIRHLDLVITCDTSIAHLAGALGAKVWVALQFGPDWRWLLEREDSPWYPTMRLFRQRQFDDWSHPMDRIASELAMLAAARGR